jgi:acyl-CoA synthetase (NDP forming)
VTAAPRDRGRVDVTGRPVARREVDLDVFFHPRTVAVIGASDTPNRPNTAMFAKIRHWAEAHGATVYPVNPNKSSIAGVPCFAQIADVPGEVDLAAILVGDVLEVLPQVLEKKARFAVVFAAGFAEVGRDGQARQAELERLIAASDLHVLGPNTNLNAFELFREDLHGRAIALITQSGHQGRPIFQGQELGIRMSYWAPTGNEADLEFADFAAWFADQADVGAIAAYIEGFKDGRSLMLAADHAAERGVPIVCVKVGRTDEGRSMAQAHTGHLTGSDAVISAVFRQFGVTRVDGLDELLDTAAALSRTQPPTGDGVCIYSISGGTGAHLADMAAAAGLRLPTLTAGSQRQLHEWIPPYLRVSNPVDNGGAPSADWRGRKILDTIVADPNVSMLICPITGALPSMGDRLAQDLVAVAETTDKPVFVVWGSPVGDESTYRDILLRSNRLAVFRTFANAVGAARAYFDYHRFRTRYRSPFRRPVLRPSPAATAAREALASAGGPALNELDSKRVLAAYGIPVSRDILCRSPRAAAAAAEAIGFPVVAKVSSSTILHKSDAGLVRVGLSSPAAVRAAYRDITEAAPDADGVLICEQVERGVECVVGVANDHLFGPVVMFGLGGVFVEVLGDVTFRVPPFSRSDAAAMLDEVNGAALLRGVRGRPAVNRRALVDLLMRVQRLAVDLSGEVAEIDLNPVSAGPDGAVALDALVVRT